MPAINSHTQSSARYTCHSNYRFCLTHHQLGVYAEESPLPVKISTYDKYCINLLSRLVLLTNFIWPLVQKIKLSRTLTLSFAAKPTAISLLCVFGDQF